MAFEKRPSSRDRWQGMSTPYAVNIHILQHAVRAAFFIVAAFGCVCSYGCLSCSAYVLCVSCTWHFKWLMHVQTALEYVFVAVGSDWTHTCYVTGQNGVAALYWRPTKGNGHRYLIKNLLKKLSLLARRFFNLIR